MLRLALLCLLLGSALSFTVSRDTFDENEEFSGDASVEDDLSVFALLEKANKNLGGAPADPVITDLDVAVGYGLQNADPCTARGCMWPRSPDGKVYVPYRISSQYSKRERDIIEDGLRSFEYQKNSGPLSCIRFIPRAAQKDFLDIVNKKGCYSNIGRSGGPQDVSLSRWGCLYKGTVQHELLHALGFHHEQKRSDRDEHVRIMWDNIEPKMKHNFKKVETNNLFTPYDYGSIMQYPRTAFSKNKQPTIVPIPDKTVPMGTAKEMGRNDILRLNRLYCSKEWDAKMKMEGKEEE